MGMRKRKLTAEAQFYLLWVLICVLAVALILQAIWLSSELSRLENIIHSGVWFLVIASDFKGNSHLFLQDRLLKPGEIFDAGIQRYVVEDCQLQSIPDESVPFTVDTTRPLSDEEADQIVGEFPTSFEVDLDWVDL